MGTKCKLVALVLILITLHLSACNVQSPLCPLDIYSDRYNATAEKFGFSGSTITPSESGVCGFAAFDGLFIVCLCTNEENEIYTADISTGSEYSKLIKDNKDAFESAALSAAYLISPLYLDEISDDDVSKLAGMILAAVDGEEVEISKDIIMNGSKTSSGGFELKISLLGK
ncbi:MAG: hypothetical protein E7675_08745 [Ruminococcaceae bacterium]|nr:hypothetical protein [Oscillospiraceae bacterium]